MSAAQEYRLVIDLDKTTPQTQPKNDLYQGDKEANVVVLEMVRKGASVTLSGYTARGSMERSDGSQVPCEGAVEGNTVRITLNEHCYVYAGPYKLDIELDGNGLRRTVAQINGVVQQTAQGPTVNINESIVDVDAVIALYGEMKTAKDETVQATQKANSAATDANSAADRANDAAQSIEGMTVSASPGAAADAEITEQDGAKHIHFTLQTGATPNITFEVATGAPGTQVQVQQSGTPEAPTVKLTIPRGDTGAVDGIDYFTGSPSALGTANPGTANGLARGDHVHPMPTAADVGALDAYAILDTLYPVGIIVPFANTVEPAAIWGGTWDLLAEGQSLIQAGDTYALGSTGGEATVKLTVETMPSHTHSYKLATKESTSSTNVYPSGVLSWMENTVDSPITTNARGGGLPHNNMPPYLAVNIWRRTV